MAPDESNAANVLSVEAMDTKPPPVGAPLPPYPESPHALMAPDESNAANALSVEAMDTKPLPVGAPVPPYVECPHALMAPDESNATNAYRFARWLKRPRATLVPGNEAVQGAMNRTMMSTHGESSLVRCELPHALLGDDVLRLPACGAGAMWHDGDPKIQRAPVPPSSAPAAARLRLRSLNLRV